MNGMDLEADAGVFLARLTPDQRQRFDVLESAYVELLSGDVLHKVDVEVLAEAVVAFYDGLAKSDVGRGKGA